VSLPLDFHQAVRNEIKDAREWYEQRRPGLGYEFLNEVERIPPEVTGMAAAALAVTLLFPLAIVYPFTAKSTNATTKSPTLIIALTWKNA